jgi:hypothetical protein
MASSTLQIFNSALTILGAQRIAAIGEDSKNFRSCDSEYVAVRDSELRAHTWRFAVKRAVLSPDVAVPAFDYSFAFAIPADCLRILPPSRLGLDWSLELHNSLRCILTNEGDTLNLVYISRVVDPNLFDPNFVDAVSAALALIICEDLTQSTSKFEKAERMYKLAVSEARRMNSFEKVADEGPEDSWVAARRAGSPGNVNWLRGVWD